MTATTLAVTELVIDRAVADGIDIGVCLLAANLKRAGWQIQPPRWRGQRWGFTSPSGEHLSTKEILRRFRAQHILFAATCDYCCQQIPTSAYIRRVRGPRTDRHYCSNRCRQAAYRSRVARGASRNGEPAA